MKRAVILVQIDDDAGTCGTLSTIIELGECAHVGNPRSEDNALLALADEVLAVYPNLASWSVTR